MWHAVHMRNPVTLFEIHQYVLEKMCHHAVYCNCDQLVDINVENFDTDELLWHRRTDNVESTGESPTMALECEFVNENVKK